ncbi:hypothetical protein NQZ68_038912 [Dissostichus eleginoides]|nr:hypothetical protein NQZ68_038912 [Dissostichus eleginoides]
MPGTDWFTIISSINYLTPQKRHRSKPELSEMCFRVSELEREKKNTQCDRKIERKEPRPGEDDDMLGGVVALGFGCYSSMSPSVPPVSSRNQNLTAEENMSHQILLPQGVKRQGLSLL